MVQALSIHRKWKGYTFDYEGSQKLVFSLKEPNFSCLLRNNAIRVSTEPRRSNKDWDFEIKGYFPDRSCSIVDSSGNIVAQVRDLCLMSFSLNYILENDTLKRDQKKKKKKLNCFFFYNYICVRF